MIENTLENKAKFFALYWGQPILMQKNGLGVKRCVQAYWEKSISTRFIELTPLSQISDEDLEYIRPLVGYSNTPEGIRLVKNWLTNLWMDSNKVNYFAITDTKPVLINLKITDFLRSRGYALPWMGLSVETLVEYGWVKLKGVGDGV